MRTRCLASSILALFAFATVVVAQRYDRLSPFDGLRWKDATPEVKLEATWYELIAIDRVGAEKIVAFAKKTFGRKWQKRVREDLVEVMSRMGKAPKRHVSLTVKALDTGKTKRLKRVRMSREKRDRLRNAAASAGLNRVSRKHGRGNATFAFLATRQQDAKQPRIPASAAKQDLDQLEWQVENRYSYRDLRGLDYRAAFDTIRAGLGDSISRSDFHVQLRKLVALFGDGHSRVRGVMGELIPGFAPCAFAAVKDRVVALQRDRLFVADRPFVRAIDGRPIADWLAAAGRLNALGSPQWERANAVSYLSFIAHLRAELGLKPSKRIEIECESAIGKRTRKTFGLSGRPSFFRDAPAARPKIPAEIGYLRIADMSDRPDAIEAMHRTMRDTVKTRGLIIDVRANGGGTRDILRALLPYFLAADAGPRVVNVGAYRLEPGQPRKRPGGYLANRFLFPRDAASWSKAERRAIDAVAKRFRPDWTPDPKRFSEWHYMVVSPDPNRPYYDRPVIVLLDAGCFSATDIFLGAFHGVPNVTLLGQPSGGGSGRSRGLVLANSGLRVKLSTMASFRPNGTRYDGVGITPDVVVDVTVDDVLGRRDSAIEVAIARLKRD